MSKFLPAVLFVLAASTSFADERERVFGTWGDARQCAREPLLEGGSVSAEPFEISADWLRHGRIWCRLNWFPIETRDGGFFTGAHAVCGEDSVAVYMLGMVLDEERLTLRWDFRRFGPLERCSAP